MLDCPKHRKTKRLLVWEDTLVVLQLVVLHRIKLASSKIPGFSFIIIDLLLK